MSLWYKIDINLCATCMNIKSSLSNEELFFIYWSYNFILTNLNFPVWYSSVLTNWWLQQHPVVRYNSEISHVFIIPWIKSSFYFHFDSFIGLCFAYYTVLNNTVLKNYNFWVNPMPTALNSTVGFANRDSQSKESFKAI